jgi:hypothetical protein
MDPLDIRRFKSPGSSGKVHGGRIDPHGKFKTWGWTACGQEFGIGKGKWVGTQWEGVKNNTKVTCLRCQRELNLKPEWIVNRLGDREIPEDFEGTDFGWGDLEWEISVCQKDYKFGLEQAYNAGRRKIILFNAEDYIIDDDDDFTWMMYVAKCTAEGLNRRRYML